MIVFDGITHALKKETQLKTRVAQFVAQRGNTPTIAAILFREDSGSQLYTRLKREAAERVGIRYLDHEFSLTDPLEKVILTIERLNQDLGITGIIVQKPWRKIWLTVNPGKSSEEYGVWWSQLMSAVASRKDVDGLHPKTMAAIKAGRWELEKKVLPATCQAVLFALEEAQATLKLPMLGKTIILGKSDLLGLPLYYVLQHRGVEVELIGSKELQARKVSGQFLQDAQVIVSATGQFQIIKGEMLNTEVILIDVGEPQPDIDRVSVQEKASFLTPVPGGIGPLTVTFLLENALQLAASS